MIYPLQRSLSTYFLFQVSVTVTRRCRSGHGMGASFRGKSGDLDVVRKSGEYISLGMALLPRSDKCEIPHKTVRLSSVQKCQLKKFCHNTYQIQQKMTVRKMG